jgi:hypothetical protein
MHYSRKTFHWITAHTDAFNKLKHKMSTAPVLGLPNFSMSFTLEIDASGCDIGTILMQQGQPTDFYRQALGPKASSSIHLS